MELIDYLLAILAAGLLVYLLESWRRRKIPKAEQERDDAENQTW